MAEGRDPEGPRSWRAAELRRRRAGQGRSRCSSLGAPSPGVSPPEASGPRCRPRPSPSAPTSSREKRPAVDRSAGGSEAARTPRCRGPVGSRGTRPCLAPSGTPGRTTWEKCGRGSLGLPLEPSPVTSTSSWLWRPGTEDRRGERWSSGDSETGRKKQMAFGIGVTPGEYGWRKGATSEGYYWAESGKILGCWKCSKS